MCGLPPLAQMAPKFVFPVTAPTSIATCQEVNSLPPLLSLPAPPSGGVFHILPLRPQAPVQRLTIPCLDYRHDFLAGLSVDLLIHLPVCSQTHFPKALLRSITSSF